MQESIRKFGLIGFNIDYSFSKKFFEKKFINENIMNCSYENFDINSFRKLVGYVPQNLYLLDDTIENNIKFGMSTSDDEERIKKCLKEAHVYDYVNELELGIKTIVGEKGVNLSGGQAQRIAIARALFNNPDIIIFDEATSSLDPKTEEKIINEINDLKAYKTIKLKTSNTVLLDIRKATV